MPDNQKAKSRILTPVTAIHHSFLMVIVKPTPDHILRNSVVICLLIARSYMVARYPELPDQLLFQFPLLFPDPDGLLGLLGALGLLGHPELLFPDHEGLLLVPVEGGFIPEPVQSTFAEQVYHLSILQVTS